MQWVKRSGDCKDGTLLAELLKDPVRLARVVEWGPPTTLFYFAV